MLTFCFALLMLILGYFTYGKFIDSRFGIEQDRTTPAFTKQDGVDFIPLPSWKVFLIQFLNIAGTGPIFGAIMGILYGPAAYLWIVFGCIFAGAVHDYYCGMISLRKGGMGLPEMIGDELGHVARHAMRVFSIVLLVLVGAVFIKTPADLLANMTADSIASLPVSPLTFWLILIFAYYILATILPIDAIIGRIYPLFGAALLLMALGVGTCIMMKDGALPELTDGLATHHPKGLPVFPMLFITIACGAISGFHGTQSPLMSRCLSTEKHGRHIFYGSMITEGIVALIWAAAAIKFFGTYDELAAAGSPAVIVNKICHSWLGAFGSILAVLGVVAAPITSGDTAFRSARLIIAEFIHLPQKNTIYRLVLCIPLFGIALALMFVNFDVLWRYFGWANQTLATFTLWACTVWLVRHGKTYWMGLLPSLFMTVVCICYILVAPEGFSLPLYIGVTAGIVGMFSCACCFFKWLKCQEKNK